MNTEEKTKQIQLLAAFLEVIIDTIREEKDGVPSGVLYASLMEHGKFSLDSYHTIISVLKEEGKIKQEGDLLFAI